MDKALSDNALDAIVSATDNPAWSTDLVYGDHFLFGTSGLAAGPAIPSCRCQRAWCSACRSDQLLRDGVQRAHADQAGVRVRSGHSGARKQLADVRADVPFDHIAGTTLKPAHERNAAARA